jgi:hypothetical protein
MRIVSCSHCSKENVPLNDTIKISGKVYCSDCFESEFPEKEDLKGLIVEKEFDPTVCASCSIDFDTIELKKISTYPICNQCETTIKNRTFPMWVKGFFIGILVIVVTAFSWNWKYYQAYDNIKQSNQYAQKGNYTQAAVLMGSASEKVPQVEDLRTLASYYKGIGLLTEDKSQAALIEFNNCKDKMPPEYNIQSLIIQARIGIGFDNKDYEAFLAASKENLALDTTLAISWTSVASAYACIYAEKGDNDAKKQAEIYLDKAKSIDSTSEAAIQYYNMVDYRLQTRQIIRREEFISKYPNGWTKN